MLLHVFVEQYGRFYKTFVLLVLSFGTTAFAAEAPARLRRFYRHLYSNNKNERDQIYYQIY